MNLAPIPLNTKNYRNRNTTQPTQHFFCFSLLLTGAFFFFCKDSFLLLQKGNFASIVVLTEWEGLSVIKIRDAKMLFDNGSFKGWHVDKHFDDWYLVLETKRTGDEVLYTNRGEVRYFKNIDSAVRIAESIGFEVSRLG